MTSHEVKLLKARIGNLLQATETAAYGSRFLSRITARKALRKDARLVKRSMNQEKRGIFNRKTT